MTLRAQNYWRGTKALDALVVLVALVALVALFSLIVLSHNLSYPSLILRLPLQMKVLISCRYRFL